MQHEPRASERKWWIQAEVIEHGRLLAKMEFIVNLLRKAVFCRQRKRIPKRSSCSRKKLKIMSTTRFQLSSMHNGPQRRNKLILHLMDIVFNAIARR